jgi:hypothetical protein
MNPATPVFKLRNPGKAEQHLHSIQIRERTAAQNCLNFDTRNPPGEKVSTLFTIDRPLPKLDIADSTPVSRSIFSIAYKEVGYPLYPPLGSKRLEFMYLLVILETLL